MKSRKVKPIVRTSLLAMCSWIALAGASHNALAQTANDTLVQGRFSWVDTGDQTGGAFMLAQNDPIYEPPIPPADAPPSEATPPSVEQATDAALSVVRARAFLGLRDYRSARAEAEMALARDPDAVGALRVLAAIDEAMGRWRHAARTWARVAALTGDDAARDRHDALVDAHPSFVGVTGFFEGAPDVDQLSGVRLDYAQRSLGGPEWSAMLEHRVGEADAVTQLDGVVAPADENRQRLDVGIADTFRFGRLGMRVSFTEEGVGGRATYGKTRPSGSFELTAGYDEPYWAYAAGLVNDASYNHLAASFNYWNDRFSLRGRIAAKEYNVRDEDLIASSAAGAVGIDYALGESANAARITYILDIEDFDSIDLRTRTDSTRYAVMPFADRTVHSLGAYKTFGERDRQFVTLGAGYRRDSESSAEGAYATLGGETEIGGQFSVGARIEYSDVSTRGTSDEPYGFGEVYLRRKF